MKKQEFKQAIKEMNEERREKSSLFFYTILSVCNLAIMLILFCLFTYHGLFLDRLMIFGEDFVGRMIGTLIWVVVSAALLEFSSHLIGVYKDYNGRLNNLK